MKKPEIDLTELSAAMGEGNTGGTEEQIQITNENALIVIAQALIGIEKHLLALVYIENTKDSEKTGVTYVPEVFAAIYDGSDPFAEVEQILKDAKEKAATDVQG